MTLCGWQDIKIQLLLLLLSVIGDWLLQVFDKSDVLGYIPVTCSNWVSFCLFVGSLICWSIHFQCFLSVPRPQLGYMSLCVVGVISGWFFSAQAVTHQTKNRCKTIQVVVWGTECMAQMQWLGTDTKRQRMEPCFAAVEIAICCWVQMEASSWLNILRGSASPECKLAVIWAITAVVIF